MTNFTPDLVALLAGMLLSLVFSYVPWVAAWYDGLSGDGKRVVMLAALVAVTLGALALTCAGLAADFGLALTCDRPGVVQAVQAFVYALIANQSTYLITPKPQKAE